MLPDGQNRETKIHLQRQLKKFSCEMKLSACHLLTNGIRITKAVSLYSSHQCKSVWNWKLYKGFQSKLTIFKHVWNTQKQVIFFCWDIIPGDTIRPSNMTKTKYLHDQRTKKLLLHIQDTPVTLFWALPLALSGLSDTVKQNAQKHKVFHLPLGQNTI